MHEERGGATRDVTTTSYDRFRAAVVRRQLLDWLPADPALVLDVSTDPCVSRLLREAGHTVVTTCAGPPTEGVQRVVADPNALDWLADESVDAVVAEGGALSRALATEVTMDGVVRVLRPGGRLLLCVDSLRMGLAHLASHGRWAELADVPAADVVLVPEDDGTIFRCFGPDELALLLHTAGLEIDWIRPRTVLASHAVESALAADAGHLSLLVHTELALAAEREGESVGHWLVASARRPVATRE